jgi:hypothetical protein
MIIIKIFCDKTDCRENKNGECQGFQAQLTSALPDPCYTEGKVWTDEGWADRSELNA